MMFAITGAVPEFQRVQDEIMEKEVFKGAFTHIDDMTICDNNEMEHDSNLARFKKLWKVKSHVI